MLGLVNNSISIAELATLVTAAGVGIYVLGLIGVALSIRLTFTNSWSTAWYAASLMPRAVVAGQGTRVWRSGMFYALFLLLGTVISTAATLWAMEILALFVEGSYLRYQIIGPPVLIAVAVAVYISVRLTRKRLENMPTEIAPRPELLSLRAMISMAGRAMISMAGIGALITLSAAYVMWRALKVDPDHVLQTTVSNWDSMAAGALLLLFGVFILGVPLAGVIEHPLPRVQIIIKPEEQAGTEAGEAEAQEAPSARSSGSSGDSVDGWLVAHTDSCWHLFVSANRLDSIPDDRVTVAHVQERVRPKPAS